MHFFFTSHIDDLKERIGMGGTMDAAVRSPS